MLLSSVCKYLEAYSGKWPSTTIPRRRILISIENVGSPSIQNVYGNNCEEVLTYFEDVYIGRFRINAPRRPPVSISYLEHVRKGK